ncbi:hypothetical protein GCM10010521_61270 [Streptomyces rameus]|uniref:Uncharacterized protein n=1 Tax=Streptomyces rameus TaxID=68261 RepID=A0ABN3V1A7_9ACTN
MSGSRLPRCPATAGVPVPGPAARARRDRLGHRTRQHPSGAPWLFLGQLADQPVTAHCLTAKLRRCGLSVVPLRNSTLVTRAADPTPSVPSSLLGISLTNALQWTRRAGWDWNAYLVGRT